MQLAPTDRSSVVVRAFETHADLPGVLVVDDGELVASNEVHIRDFHATILHLVGLDHERLTYRYAGRDFRLTDVHGEVVSGLIA